MRNSPRNTNIKGSEPKQKLYCSVEPDEHDEFLTVSFKTNLRIASLMLIAMRLLIKVYKEHTPGQPFVIDKPDELFKVTLKDSR